MAKSPEELAQTMIDNMPDKTGKALGDWQTIVAASGAVKHGEIMKLLKGEHGVSHGFANLIAQKCIGNLDVSDEDLVTNQYQGKEGLKPIHDAIVSHVKGFGTELEIAPKKTSVSLRRKKQFALIQPSTKTRIDLGLNLKGVEPQGRLEAMTGMCTHKIRLTSLDEFDAETKDWLKQAFERAG
ncbi:MAG: DUF4287 domain-containing protein [Hyphomonadaceae bacterium]|nr:DUF4287 domain-containing protein [Hyphomonadaceae bacterium]